jgi:hypothetical protein
LSWDSLWLSQDLAKNHTFTSLSIGHLWIEKENGEEDDQMRVVETVHDCLKTNLFIETIKLHDENDRYRLPFLSGDALTAWQSNVLPLLESNRQHHHRMNADLYQGSLADLHQKVVLVRSHPKKLFKLLRDFPRAMVPRLLSEQVRDLERFNDKQQDREVELEIKNADLERKSIAQQKQIVALQAKDAAKQERINSQQEDIDSLRREVVYLQGQMSALLLI